MLMKLRERPATAKKKKPVANLWILGAAAFALGAILYWLLLR